MVKRLFFAVILTATTMLASAQAINEVTLIVNGDGANKTEAINVALRSAIEQAFGAFVSANTTILNDELVKDEIATISSGNVQKFKEIGVSTSPDGRVSVMVEATVSVQKLVKYAHNKGSECEFAGATLMANHKLLQLRYDNAKKAITYLPQFIKSMGPKVFDYKLIVGKPNIKNGIATITMTVQYVPNKNTKQFFKTIRQTAKMCNFTREELRQIGKEGYTPTYNGCLYLGCFPIDLESQYNLSGLLNQVLFNSFQIKTNEGKIIDHPFFSGRTKPDFGSGFCHWLFIGNYNHYIYSPTPLGYSIKGGSEEFTIKISVEELSTISKFTIEPIH